MNWRVVVRPEVEQDIADAATWHDSKEPGLGAEFEVSDPDKMVIVAAVLHAARHDIRWRQRFA